MWFHLPQPNPKFRITSTHNRYGPLSHDLEDYILLGARLRSLDNDNNGGHHLHEVTNHLMPPNGQNFQILPPKGVHKEKRKLEEDEEEDPIGRTSKKERSEAGREQVQ